MSSREYTKYERAILDQIKREVEGEDPVTANFRLKEFLSYSQGKDRKPRRNPREVQLLQERGGKQHRSLAARQTNVAEIAAQALGESVPSEDHVDTFFERLRRRL